MSLRKSLGLVAGLTMLTAAAVSFAYEGRAIREGWANMGPLAPGTEIPEFRARTLEGERFDNAALEGKVTLMVFWTTWCGVCKDELPEVAEIRREYQKMYGDRFQVVGVNADRKVDQSVAVVQYKEDHGLDLPMVLDSGRLSQSFRVHVFPHTVIVDESGNLINVHEGKVRRSRLEDELDALLARK